MNTLTHQRGLMYIIGIPLLLALICFPWPVKAAQVVQVKDVSPNHPAYEAVVMLASKGYLPIAQDGTFRGNDPVDRYTLATALAYAIEDMAANGGSGQDIKLLTKLIDEYHAELVSFYANQSKLASGLDEEIRRNNALSQQISQFLITVQELTSKTERTQESLSVLSSSVNEQFAFADTQRATIERNLSALSTNTSSNLNKLDALVQQLQHDLTKLEEGQKQSENYLRNEAEALVKQINYQLSMQISGTQESLSALSLSVNEKFAYAGTQRENLNTLIQQLQKDHDDLDKAQKQSETNLRSESLAFANQLTARTDGLESRIVVNEDSIKMLQQDTLGLDTTLNELIKRIDTSLTQLDANLTAQKAIAEGDVQTLLNRLSEQSAAIALHGTQIGELQAQVDQLSEAIQQQINATETRLTTAINLLEQRITNIEARLTTQEDLLNTARQDISNMQTELTQQKDYLLAQMDQKDNVLLATMNKQREELLGLMDMQSQLEAGMSLQGQELQSALQQKEQGVFSALSGQKEEMQTSLAQLQAANEQITTSLQNAINENTSRIDNLDTVTNTHSQQIEELQQTVTEQAADLTATNQQLKDLLDENLVSMTQSLTTQAQQQTSDLSAMEERMQAILNQHAEALAAQQAALQQAKADFQTQLQEQEQRYTEDREALANQIKQLETQLAAAQADIQKLQLMYADVESRISLSTAQLDELERSLRSKVLDEGNKALLREKDLRSSLNNISDELAQYKEDSDAKIGSTRVLAFTLPILAALLGILVNP
jgi:chromosome segregation ATPase